MRTLGYNVVANIVNCNYEVANIQLQVSDCMYDVEVSGYKYPVSVQVSGFKYYVARWKYQVECIRLLASC